ncbi:unnamed protein product [Spodoptera exigua]|nr:unnamed protein product [Spodoptera exigua]
MRYFCLTVLIIYLGTVEAGLFLNLKDDVVAIWEERHAQKKATSVKEKRTFRKFLIEPSKNTTLHQNNVTHLARARNGDQKSTDFDAAAKFPVPMPVFRTELDNQNAHSPKENKVSQNKTNIFKLGRSSNKYAIDTSVSEVNSFLNTPNIIGSKAKFKTLTDNNNKDGMKKDRNSEIHKLKKERKPEILQDQNKSSILNKEGVTNIFSKVTRKLKLMSNGIITKNENNVKSREIFREHSKDFYVSKDHSKTLSGQNNTASVEKVRPHEKHTDTIKHNLTKHHETLVNTPNFRGRLIDSDSSSISSDVDRITGMEEFKDQWMQKKYEALNSTQLRGDVVNMAAARPWGVPCGDPNQHDTPWGSCTTPAECDPEYRIYRGDYFCGRTSFVCCTLIMTNYDLYQGLDISMEGSSESTDSSEIKNHNPDEVARKIQKKKHKKRRRERARKKKLIRNHIKRITRQFKRILNSAYRNRSAETRKKTVALQKFIENMKEEFKKDRISLLKIRHYDVLKMYDKLQAKLNKITSFNENFMNNDTFRNIVLNGDVDKDKLKQYLRSQPEFKKYFKNKRRYRTKGISKNTRNVKHMKRVNERKPKKRNLRKRKHEKRNSKKRNYPHARRNGITDLDFGMDEEDQQLENIQLKNFDYDVEYGVLYY